ncbi:uncharacterized protein LOC110943608 [Helianthus annuus]|uniref:uncharacterized protein LOC110943608 n=1 Tax=Helianthus annuus TaxID=4232 RepID=UPI000B8F2825|nr:uncharacterized protein LOC110943608 [Helianthus annuus]
MFCFCCKVFRTGAPKGRLEGESFNDRHHAAGRVKAHEVTLDHLTHMKMWFDMRKRLRENQTIDKDQYEILKKETDYWKKVLLRIVALVKFLAKHNLAFRNGNFLGIIEMLEEFDLVIKEHVRRIISGDLHVHYLGHNIQNEIILFLADEIKKELIKNIKEAKYYSIILDCTPDSNHQEQMTIIVRYVKISSNSSQTRWESRFESVKAIKLHLADLREALLQVGETDNDAAIADEAISLAERELSDFDFLVSIVIWYEVLNQVNFVSKKLQAKDMHLEIVIQEINNLIKYFKEYRENGFSKAIDEAREIASEMDIDPIFIQKRIIKRKKRNDESSSSEVAFTVEENFRVNYFLYTVDQALASLEKRFDQFKWYEGLFGFLFPHKLRNIKDQVVLLSS